MGRQRTFDEAEVIVQSASVFLRQGYEGTSIDDLLAATGLHRGSLYKAFASKRGLFLAALQHYIRYLAEVMPGDEIAIHGRLLGVGHGDGHQRDGHQRHRQHGQGFAK